ncbi:MAG: preprotein translocase subunit SecE [Candidatus Cloacimonetes bacterium]|nr:preprotein translocase subunit SecE [Candidatus Cloacimonadota bacterium]MBS3766902.1 preprotein translocase subunit SecE [Candidatus Cloacimonadota bacterium]
MFKKIFQFFKEVRQELRHVAWPSIEDLKEGTSVVITFSVMLGIFIWIIDNIFTQIVRLVILQ